MKEFALERKVVAYCREQGLLCYKFSSPARRGVPDRIILYRGRVMFLELKAPGCKPTKLQEREMSLLGEAGFSATWVDNFKDARTTLNDMFELWERVENAGVI